MMLSATTEPCKMAVVCTTTAQVLHESYGRKGFVITESQRFLDQQDADMVAAGYFGLDYSEHCGDCCSYHSPEADCA